MVFSLFFIYFSSVLFFFFGCCFVCYVVDCCWFVVALFFFCFQSHSSIPLLLQNEFIYCNRVVTVIGKGYLFWMHWMCYVENRNRLYSKGKSFHCLSIIIESVFFSQCFSDVLFCICIIFKILPFKLCAALNLIEKNHINWTEIPFRHLKSAWIHHIVCKSKKHCA